MPTFRNAAALCAAAFVFYSGLAAADRWDKMDARVEALERQAQNPGQVAADLQRMQDELRTLRGEIEQLRHEAEQAKLREREQYFAMEARLKKLEQQQTNQSYLPAPAAPAVGSAPVTNGGTPAAAGNEQADYQAAFELLKQGRYNDAATSFKSFLERYPASSYADGSRYWLGESYFSLRNFPAALAAFQQLVTTHKDASKVPGALLKIGYSHYELADYANARLALEKVRSQYPGTSVADLATQRLQRMQAEGR
ncbi:MAG: tol-pal system protein YbgF [Nevskiales bacterium]